MAKNILVGQTVRINERYAEIINGKIGQDARKMQNQVGTTNLTPDQAEQLAHDLLARVAEIRGGQN